MKERIKKVRKSEGLTQVEFGERIGVKGNTVTNYETGLRTPTDAVLLSICREFNVNEEWLRTGNGEMFNPEIPNQEIANMLADVLKLENKDFRKRLLVALSKLDSDGWHELEKFIDSISNPSPPDEEE